MAALASPGHVTEPRLRLADHFTEPQHTGGRLGHHRHDADAARRQFMLGFEGIQIVRDAGQVLRPEELRQDDACGTQRHGRHQIAQQFARP